MGRLHRLYDTLYYGTIYATVALGACLVMIYERFLGPDRRHLRLTWHDWTLTLSGKRDE